HPGQGLPGADIVSPLPPPSPGDQTFWQPHLDPGERLLWAVRPPFLRHLSVYNVVGPVFGFAFGCVVAIWLSMAGFRGLANESISSNILGGVLLLIAVVFPSLILVTPAIERWRTRYALTNLRCLIRCGAFVDQLVSIPLTSDRIFVVTGRHKGSVVNEIPGARNEMFQRPLGFHNIRDPLAVFDLIRHVQEGRA
ncbi:MAG: hypothetical protein AAGI70_16970, partial [Pseudomonadota bacterium]